MGEFEEAVEHRKTPKTWGPRTLRDDFRDHMGATDLQGDPRHQVAAAAQAMTTPGRDMDKFVESHQASGIQVFLETQQRLTRECS